MLPEITEQILKPQFERLEIEFKQMLDAFAECFRQGDCWFQLPTVRGALSEMDHSIQQIRDRNMLADLPLEAPLRVLDLVDRYHASSEALEECGRLVRTLEIRVIGAIMRCSTWQIGRRRRNQKPPFSARAEIRIRNANGRELMVSVRSIRVSFKNV